MLHLHSALRYILLIILLMAIINSLRGWISKKEFSKGDEKTGLILMIIAHVQLLLGLFLYMTEGWLSISFADAMSDAVSRFWKVEHLAGMFIAIILITIGRMRAKRLSDDLRKHKSSFIYYTIALIIILKMIPWEAGRLLF